MFQFRRTLFKLISAYGWKDNIDNVARFVQICNVSRKNNLSSFKMKRLWETSLSLTSTESTCTGHRLRYITLTKLISTSQLCHNLRATLESLQVCIVISYRRSQEESYFFSFGTPRALNTFSSASARSET